MSTIRWAQLNPDKAGTPSLSPKSLEELDLELVPMSPEFLAVMLEGHGKPDQAFEEIRLWGGWDADDAAVISYRLTQLREKPELQPWLMHAIVRCSDQQMVGHVGFHGAPGLYSLGHAFPGALEIGYTVFAPFRRRGYAACAVAALIKWARTERGVSYFVASINQENVASQKVVAKVGFKFFRDFVLNDPDREDVYVLQLGPENSPDTPEADLGVET